MSIGDGFRFALGAALAGPVLLLGAVVIGVGAIIVAEAIDPRLNPLR